LNDSPSRPSLHDLPLQQIKQVSEKEETVHSTKEVNETGTAEEEKVLMFEEE